MLDGTTREEIGSVVETPKGFIEVRGKPKVPEGGRVDKITKLAGPIPGPLDPGINTGNGYGKFSSIGGTSRF